MELELELGSAVLVVVLPQSWAEEEDLGEGGPGQGNVEPEVVGSWRFGLYRALGAESLGLEEVAYVYFWSGQLGDEQALTEQSSPEEEPACVGRNPWLGPGQLEDEPDQELGVAYWKWYPAEDEQD